LVFFEIAAKLGFYPQTLNNFKINGHLLLLQFKSDEMTPKNKNTANPATQIPAKGSLGLLAYGARGIIAWREVRIKNAEKIIENKQQPNTTEQ
jgi:hypothetical protein